MTRITPGSQSGVNKHMLEAKEDSEMTDMNSEKIDADKTAKAPVELADQALDNASGGRLGEPDDGGEIARKKKK